MEAAQGSGRSDTYTYRKNSPRIVLVHGTRFPQR